ncbi:MAG TPA: nuclear transport factor 2 family protein [Gemmatimonadota bacterium]|nr:nuclear transport factor 2 family protein [Gemmatimonadota bacterium]
MSARARSPAVSFLTGLAVLAVLPACAVHIGNTNGGDRADGWTSSRREAVVRVLEEQVQAWNRGDLEAFMQGYWQSPELVFTSGARVQRGWRTTLERYREAYGDSPGTMGRLSFSDLEVHPLGADAAWMLGRWSLAMGPGGERGGVFTLVFRRLDGEWRIVHDHTTEAGSAGEGESAGEAGSD